MNDAKHTKGPWKLSGCEMQRNGFRNPMVECGESHEPLIAEMYGQDRPFAEKQANARLIAAAPDLLAACEAALPWIGKMIADGAHMNSVAPNACVGAMQRLDAAIRKAEGK